MPLAGSAYSQPLGNGYSLPVLEILASTWEATAPKRAPHAPAPPLAHAAQELLPRLIAILIVLSALSLPVLLILWRLHRPYE